MSENADSVSEDPQRDPQSASDQPVETPQDAAAESAPAQPNSVSSEPASSDVVPPTPAASSDTAAANNPTAAEEPAAADNSESSAPGEVAGEAAQPRRAIQVGRRADDPGPKPKAKPAPLDISGKANPKSSGSNPTARPPLPPKPSRRSPLTDDLEAEINAALGGMSLDSIVDQGGAGGEELEPDSRQQATVLRVDTENVFFTLGGRHEGVAPLRQFETPPEIGAQLEVLVSGFNSEDGLYELLIPGASIEVGDWSDISEGALVEALVTGSNTGGLECQVNKLRGFIPASQISLYRVDNLPEFVDQKMVCVVTEADPERRNLVLSRRAVLEREREESRQKLINELAPGQIREGIVRNIRDFGAFVDLGGVDGLIHISQLSWERVKHPSDVVSEGDQVKVKVEKIDPETGKIGLSLRDMTTHPWANASQEFMAGTVVRGTVSRIAEFGAFVKLAPGIEGLVHISEVAHQRVQRVSSHLKEGQEIDVKILDVDPDKQRMSLSIKQTQQAPVDKNKKPEEEAPPAERTFKQPTGPLKGGVDRPSGGEGFGLKW